MTIFRRYVEDLWPKVPTVLRRFSKNIINLAVGQMYAAQDVIAEALQSYIETSWPIDTASPWVLDEHWGPYHNIQRNGTTDPVFRRYIHAKRYLNRSWGSGDQALTIFGVLLPTAALTFSYFAPKSWVVNITGVDMAAATLATNFMRKNPSPQGGGFSVAGDNGERPAPPLSALPRAERLRIIRDLEKEMHKSAEELRFEEAASCATKSSSCAAVCKKNRTCPRGRKMCWKRTSCSTRSPARRRNGVTLRRTRTLSVSP